MTEVTMKIGVISDTHLTGSNHFLEEVIEKYFDDAALILHAGDLISLAVLHAFKGKEVIAVAGNSDASEVKKKLHIKEIITADRFKIGLIHGWGIPIGLGKRVEASFDEVDCIIYGHSHWAVNYYRNGILHFNPGSFLGGISSLWRPSIGLLTVDKKIRGEIIRL